MNPHGQSFTFKRFCSSAVSTYSFCKQRLLYVPTCKNSLATCINSKYTVKHFLVPHLSSNWICYLCNVYSNDIVMLTLSLREQDIFTELLLNFIFMDLLLTVLLMYELSFYWEKKKNSLENVNTVLKSVSSSTSEAINKIEVTKKIHKVWHKDALEI